MSELKGKKVVIIGAGPNIIGQSGECDEGAVEACHALSSTGCRIIAIDSNPDAQLTNAVQTETVYIEPLTPDSLRRVIETERPAAVLPAFGGRVSLHLVARLSKDGVLAQYGVKILGPSADCIDRLLDREALKSALGDIGLNTPPIYTVNGIDAAVEKAQAIGFPVVLRCNNPDLIPDGILAYNQDELRLKAARLPAESVQAYSVETSLVGWQQVELEILRDAAGQTEIAGWIEYLDSAAIHPGDALAVCPPQSLPDPLAGQLKNDAAAISAHLGIVGGVTVRFACNPTDGRVLVLAVHPRYTRTSAMVARATGRPLGKAAALLAAGCGLTQLPDAMQSTTADATRSSLAAVKWPVWDFDRLDETVDRLGPQMQAVGQSIALGGSFKEALHKAARSVTQSCDGFGAAPYAHLSEAELLSQMATPSSQSVWLVYEAIRKGIPEAEILQRTHYSTWFVRQLADLVLTEQGVKDNSTPEIDPDVLRQAVTDGFAGACIAKLAGVSKDSVERQLSAPGLTRHWRAYSTDKPAKLFSSAGSGDGEVHPSKSKSILIIGSGPHAIGQGPECDNGALKAAEAANQLGYEVSIINSNLTSLTTGNASPIRGYCEPLAMDDIMAVIRREQPFGVVTQFAGLQSVDLTDQLSNAGVPIIGTPIETIRLLQNHNAFHEQMRRIGIPQPTGLLTRNRADVDKAVPAVGFPMLVQHASRSSDDVTRIVRDAETLDDLIENRIVRPDEPLFIEQFLEFGIEAQAETLCDGTKAHVAAVIEHIELAGVHAGDSACVTPPYSIAPRHIDTIGEYCRKIAIALAIRGSINMRFAIYRDTVYLLDAACHAARNLSLIEKTHRIPLADMAIRLMTGQALDDLPLPSPPTPRVGLRAAVFPFNVFSEEDPLLGPRMRSTGQVLASADTFGLAYFKALESAGTPLPTHGTVLITVTDEDKASILEPARIFQELGFKLMATRGTQAALSENGMESQAVRKLGFGRPDLVDEIKNGRVQMVINTPTGGQGQIDDSLIRKAAIQAKIANITTPASALAAAKGIAARRSGVPEEQLG
jgi:carbamoyl-phosphate synthase large subunit